MQKLAVIYNPFSGRKKVKDLPALILEHINRDLFEVMIWPTEKPDDVLMLAQRAIQMRVDIVLGAGGDGTINQIASRLVNTGIKLGIIPLGSGNGFARHFCIPMDTVSSIKALAHYKTRDIDTIWFNNHCMINVGGIGFDATVSAAFASNKKRGLPGYVRTIVKNLAYKSLNYVLIHEGKILWKGDAFMIGIANATQWGNNVIMHPGARPDDGLMNIVILRKFSVSDFFGIIKNLMEGKLFSNKSSELFIGTDFTILRQQEGPVHVDGEPLWLGKEININIEPLSLKILSNV